MKNVFFPCKLILLKKNVFFKLLQIMNQVNYSIYSKLQYIYINHSIQIKSGVYKVMTVGVSFSKRRTETVSDKYYFTLFRGGKAWLTEHA